MPLPIDAAPPADPRESSGLTLGGGSHLPERDGHRAWWSTGGVASPSALPVLMVHGGPGGQSRPEPLVWWQGLDVRWIALDQRGCGRSLPVGAIDAGNRLDGLVDDMERLRVALGLERWAISGGSWGAVVALAYALRHPQRVDGLLLRSAFLGSAAEGGRYIAPWFAWLGAAGRDALGEDADALHRLFLPATAMCQAETRLYPEPASASWRDEALIAEAWSRFDDAQAQPGGARADGWKPLPSPPPPVSASWRVFIHYARNGWCLERPLADRLAADGAALRERPLTLVHGALDACCDPETSAGLARWHGAARRLEVPGGGHRMAQDVMAEAMRRAAVGWIEDLRAARERPR